MCFANCPNRSLSELTMSSLPDHVWLRVLEIGTETRRLDHRALCHLSMVNSKFNELSNDPSLWATLLSHDFPSSHYQSSEAPSKSLYRKKFEEEKMAATEARRSSGCISNYRTDFYVLCRIICPRCRLLPAPFDPSEHEFHVIDVYRYAAETSGTYTLEMEPPQDCITDKRTLHLEHKFNRSCNMGRKSKAIPNSRYYAPLHKPRRQAMPRKI